MGEDNYSAIIWLTQGQYAIIDEEDRRLLSAHKWRYNKNHYALSHPSYRMHRLILNAPADKFVDHINGDGLDNRKANLRLCTNKQNCRNSKIPDTNKSGYKGVNKHAQVDKWRAYITVDGKQRSLGLYHCKIEAAEAYNKAAIKYFGEYARLNKIDG